MKKLMISVSVALVLAVTAVGAYMAWSLKGLSDHTAERLDLSRVPDGVYRGSCDYLGFSCSAAVTVKDHRITDIKVTKGRDDDPYFREASAVTRRIIEEQSLDVDAVTGATITSRAMIRAVENALTGKGAE